VITSTLDTPYELPSDAPSRFEDDGFVRLSGVLDAETVEHYEPVITDQVIELNTMHLPLEERDTYSKAFLQVENLWEHGGAVRELVFSQRLAKLAADLLGVDGVRLYHDQALYKESGGGVTPWHADQYYWPLATDRVCTLWLPLQETTSEMGPLAFAAGSHRFSFGRDLPISDESEEKLAAALEEQRFRVVDEPFLLGDASFHFGWTFHHASPNTAPNPRRVMTIIYMDAAMTVAEPTNRNQHADLNRWMPGAVPGEAPDTPLNPILYHR
jgi:hypothetical protein